MSIQSYQRSPASPNPKADLLCPMATPTPEETSSYVKSPPVPSKGLRPTKKLPIQSKKELEDSTLDQSDNTKSFKKVNRGRNASRSTLTKQEVVHHSFLASLDKSQLKLVQESFSFSIEQLLVFERDYNQEFFLPPLREGKEFQADLDRKDLRKLKLEVPDHFGQSMNRKNPLFRLKCAEARKQVWEKFGKTITDSQVYDLMSNCPTEEVFWNLLCNERFLIKEYLS